MRNLKKILALALALVMTMSVMSIASAKSLDSYADANQVSAKHEIAVDVATQLGILEGVTETNYAPQGTLTRAQLATMIYRITTGDVKGTYVSNFAAGAAAKFSDVSATAWYAGYVGYCADAGYLQGVGDGKYAPNSTLTGYQALAALLRAIGYNQPGEFTGADWTVRVAQIATQAKVAEGVVTDLNKAITREQAAQFLYNALFAAKVEYTPAFGYSSATSYLGAADDLATDIFKIVTGKAGVAGVTIDKWGRPGTVWYNTAGAAVVTIADDALKTYNVATTECTIASDIGLKVNTTFDLYTNGAAATNVSDYIVQPTDTVQTLGAQGSLIEVYADRILVIDTFLAKVTAVAPATYDAAGHKISDSRIDLLVYNTATGVATTGTAMYQTNGTTNYTYNVGDMVLVNTYTTNTVNYTTGDVTVTAPAVTSGKADYVEIKGLAQTLVGAQTFLWYNADQHTVNGTNYNDAKWFKLDQAGVETTNHTWYFDSYGNLIGATDIATQYSYGIIENIQWINPAMAVGYAQATIRYMDGSTATQVIASIDALGLTYADSTALGRKVAATGTAGTAGYVAAHYQVSTVLQNNGDLCGKDLYRIETNATGTISLVHVFHTDVVSGTSTSYNSQLTAATIKGNSTVTALAAITGTAATGDAHSVIYTNSNTVFLVQSATAPYTYTVVKGYENMASYTGTATVDYVNLDGDSYADYVYVTGTPDSATSYKMFFLTSNNVKAVLNATGGVAYYEVNGILDGVATTIKANATATTNLLAGGVNGMSFVHMTNGLVDSAVNLNNDSPLTGIVGSVYYNLYQDYHVGSGTAGDVTYDGEVLKVGSAYYNVVGLTPVFGTWAADMSGKTVYVIYDASNTLAGAYVAKAVYIVDAANGSANSGSGLVTNGTIVRTLNIVNKDTGAIIATYTDTVTVTGGTSITYTVAGMAGSVFGISTTNLVAFGVNSVTVAPAAGQTVSATLNAYYAN